MKLDRIQLSNILNVKLSGLETIERRNQLKERLKETGYNFIKKIREGKNNFYIVKELKTSEERKLYNSLCRYAYNTNKPDQFGLFFNVRTDNTGKAITNKEISELTNVGINTLTKWNNCLLDKRIIVRDGFFYFYINNYSKSITSCSKEEYKTFWKNKKILKGENNFKMHI